MRASLALAVLLGGCALPIVDDESEALCLQWNDALAAYYHRCGVDDALARSWVDPKRDKCRRAIVREPDAVRACMTGLERATCDVEHPNCAAISYRPFVL